MPVIEDTKGLWIKTMAPQVVVDAIIAKKKYRYG